MAKGKKDIQVDEVRHPSGVTVPIMFNPNQPRYSGHEHGLTFSARIAENIGFREKSADAVKEAVVKYLDENSKLDWHPVIEIVELAPFAASRADHFVGFEIDRFYLAETKNEKRLRELKWRDYEPDDENWMTKKRYDEIGNIDIARITESKEFHGFNGKLPDDLPFRNNGHDKEVFIVPYDEKQWVALEQIQEGIARLKSKLRDLTGTTEGLKQLEIMGASLLKMLPAPEPEKS